MKRWRIGLVGLGAAARNIHLPALKKIGNVDVVGGFDPAASRSAVPMFASLDELLATGLDMLVVATPPVSHLAIVAAGLAAGCHVFCEKPLAATLAEADEMMVLAARAGRRVVVNSEFPYMPIHSVPRSLIGTERFGDLRFIEIQQSFHVTAEVEAGWRGADLQRTFKEFGTHVIDLCIDLFDAPPLSFEARMPGIDGGRKPDYLDLVRLYFPGDRVAQITLDRLTKGRHRYLDMRLVGERATIETSIGGRAAIAIGMRAQDRRPFLDIDLAPAGSARLFTGERFTTIARAPFDLFADATARLLRAVLAAIEEGRTPPNDLADARQTLAILYGCYEQAAAAAGS